MVEKMKKNNFPICMTEAFWANSHFSVVRHTGEIIVDGYTYVIVNKEGKDIFECSIEADRAGREKAIEPGEPADLVRRDFVKYYRKLGRDKFIEVLKDNPTASAKYLERIFKEIIKP